MKCAEDSTSTPPSSPTSRQCMPPSAEKPGAKASPALLSTSSKTTAIQACDLPNGHPKASNKHKAPENNRNLAASKVACGFADQTGFAYHNRTPIQRAKPARP